MFTFVTTKQTTKMETKLEHTDKLLKALSAHVECVEGKVSTNKDGVKYRYDHYKNRLTTTPYWLELLWNKATTENGKPHATQFHAYGVYSFGFKRAVFKGHKHGNIEYTKLVILD